MKKSKITYYLESIGMTIMLPIFMIVMWTEKLMAKMLHLTYNEVNILVYYLLIPLSWAAIVDYKIGYPILSIIVIFLWSCILWKVRNDFSYFCDVAFRVSQVFLLKFRKIGWNYIVSSVIVCVVIPVLIYILLLSF